MNIRLFGVSLALSVILMASFPTMAQNFASDGRLNSDAAAPIVLFCNTNGLEAYRAIGGESFRATRNQIEVALGQAVLNSVATPVVYGTGGAQLTAYPDGALVMTAPQYSFAVPSNACNGFRANFNNTLVSLVDAVDLLFSEASTTTNSTQTVLVIPNGTRTHTVQAGENLFRIGIRYGVPYRQIATANGITDASRITVGQVLVIP
ncbi:MAG: LysM peptidoglycan-binding domain-containing protein [Phototrophicaceae bacterium]|jgi:LysM repeat protein